MVPAFLEGEIKTDVKNTKIRRQLNLNRLCWDVFNCTHTHTHTHTVIAGFFLPGEFHGQRNLAMYLIAHTHTLS